MDNREEEVKGWTLVADEKDDSDSGDDNNDDGGWNVKAERTGNVVLQIIIIIQKVLLFVNTESSPRYTTLMVSWLVGWLVGYLVTWLVS